MNKASKTTRRRFLQNGTSILGAALAAPLIVPARALGKEGAVAPSERIGMAFLGMGTMGDGHLFGRAWTYLPGGYSAREDVQVLALCDVRRSKREKARQELNRTYAKKAGTSGYKGVKVYKDFRDILIRDDIDAVLVATPIHWHATMSVMAAKAGKDVYCEKPTAGTIQESKAVVKAVLENKRVFQAGTQQRSEYDAKFRIACEMIRNGRIGKLQEVYTYREGGGVDWSVKPGDTVPVPDELDWDLWLGPAPRMPYWGNAGAHLFGFGGINWGQHHYDIVQWILDADRTGPIEIDVDDGGRAVYRYANGVTVYGRPYGDEKIGETGGGWYIGSEGKIAVDREHLVSDPEAILQKPLGPNDRRVYRSDSHSGNFLECVKTRKLTICNVETAHRAASALLLGGIAQKLKRRLVWDPVQERFTNDDEANRMLSIPKRSPWRI